MMSLLKYSFFYSSLIFFSISCKTAKKTFADEVGFLLTLTYVDKWDKWVLNNSKDKTLIPFEETVDPNKYLSFEDYRKAYEEKNPLFYNVIDVSENEIILSTGIESFSEQVILKEVLKNDTIFLVFVTVQISDNSSLGFENHFYIKKQDQSFVEIYPLSFYSVSKEIEMFNLEQRITYGKRADTLFVNYLFQDYKKNDSLSSGVISKGNSKLYNLLNFKYMYVLDSRKLLFEKVDSMALYN